VNAFVYIFGIIYNIKSSFVKNPVWCLKQELTILSTCSRICFVVEVTGCTWVHPRFLVGFVLLDL